MGSEIVFAVTINLAVQQKFQAKLWFVDNIFLDITLRREGNFLVGFSYFLSVFGIRG